MRLEDREVNEIFTYSTPAAEGKARAGGTIDVDGAHAGSPLEAPAEKPIKSPCVSPNSGDPQKHYPHPKQQREPSLSIRELAPLLNFKTFDTASYITLSVCSPPEADTPSSDHVGSVCWSSSMLLEVTVLKQPA